MDPGSSDLFHKWRKCGEENQRIFEEIFAVLPSDSVHAMPHDSGLFDRKTEDYSMWEERYKNRIEIQNPKLAMEKMKQLNGYLINFPLRFLEDERKITDLSSLLKNLSLAATPKGLAHLFLSNLFQ